MKDEALWLTSYNVTQAHIILRGQFEILWRKFESVRILIFDHKNTMNNCAFWENDVIWGTDKGEKKFQHLF